MTKSAPDDYFNLNIKDYPDKNERQVNELSIHNVTANEVKRQISREIYAEIDPTVEQKTAGRNKFIRVSTKKAVHFLIRQAVGQAVDTMQRRLQEQYGASKKSK